MKRTPRPEPAPFRSRLAPLRPSLAVATALLCLACGAAESDPLEPSGREPVVQTPGTLRMVARLREHKAARYRSDAYDNPVRVGWIEEELAEAPTDRAAAALQFALARELLWAGRTHEALERFGILQAEIDAGRDVDPDLGPEVTSLLATASLRLGEEENCIARHGVDSCLLPIRAGGVHVAEEGSRGAMAGFRRLLAADPGDLRSRWLLNLAHMTLGEYPTEVSPPWRIPAASFASDHDIGRFYDVAGVAGLDVEGLAGGCIVDDFDLDGDVDVMVSSRGLGPSDQVHYLENLGDGSFADRTDQAGLRGIVGGLNMISGDFDNDGLVDAFVLRGGWMLGKSGRQPNSLLRNLGGGRFTDATEEAGLLSFRPTQTAAVGDYDNDGWLDLFIGNEATRSKPHPCELYHNNGDGTFTDVAAELGLEVNAYVKGAAWGDYDNDGRLDLYVTKANNVSPAWLPAGNLLFHNDGPGMDGSWSFTDRAEEAGVREPRAGFSTWFFDYDNDGWLDLYATRYDATLTDVVKDYLSPEERAASADETRPGRPCLYRNNHDGTFTDLGPELGFDQALMTMGCNYGDLDNDGWLDVYFGTGEPDFRTLVPNRMFRNDRGQAFQDVTTSGGFGHLQKGHGTVFTDIDNDGDQDVFMVMGGGYTADTFRNALFLNPGHGNHWLGLELVGTRSNRDAVGARIRVSVERAGERREIFATVSNGGAFGSHDFAQRIGLGDADRITAVRVRWPSGLRTELTADLGLDRLYRLVEGEDTPLPLELGRFTLEPDLEGGLHRDCCAPGTEAAQTCCEKPARPI